MFFVFFYNIIRNVILKMKWKSRLSFSFTAKIAINSEFEGMNKIYKNTYFKGHMGYGSYIGPYCYLVANIGKFTSIAPFVRCNSGIHPYKHPYATTSPCFFSKKKQNGYTFVKQQKMIEQVFVDGESKYAVKLGNDCWVGEGAFIVGGVSIADGAVVLAHAVVTKDVPAYAIVGGVPAKIVGYRYDDDTIRFLQEIEWWNNHQDWFEQNWELLCNIDKLKMHYKSK